MKKAKVTIDWKNEPEVKVKPIVCELCEGGLIKKGSSFVRCDACEGTGLTK